MFWQQFSTILQKKKKKKSKLCVFLSKKDFFFFFHSYCCLNQDFKVKLPFTKMIPGPSTHLSRNQLWFENLPFYFGDNRYVVMQGKMVIEATSSGHARLELHLWDLLLTPRPWDPHVCSPLVQSVKISLSSHQYNPETLMKFTSVVVFFLHYKNETWRSSRRRKWGFVLKAFIQPHKL